MCARKVYVLCTLNHIIIIIIIGIDFPKMRENRNLWARCLVNESEKGNEYRKLYGLWKLLGNFQADFNFKGNHID